MGTRIDLIGQKIMGPAALSRALATWRFMGRKIVFTNGCFDILHLGHVDYLSRAADLGDVLIIGLNTDDSVRRLKGHGRPICDQHARAMVLASLSFIHAVTLFDDDTPLKLIELVKPDILVKGGDYRAEEIVGYDIVRNTGGSVIILPFLEGYSTSGLERKIREG